MAADGDQGPQESDDQTHRREPVRKEAFTHQSSVKSSFHKV